MRRETTRERLDQLDAIIPPMLVEIEALRLLFGLLLDFDFDRHAETTTEPFMFEMQTALEDMLQEADPQSADAAEQIKAAAICSAMLLADRGESVDVVIDVDDDRPANDD